MRKTFLMIGLILLASLTAAAQEEVSTPKAELFTGYSFAGEGSHGFDASIAGNVNSWFGLVADVGGQYTNIEDTDVRENIRAHSFLFGPRFSVRKHKRVTPFAHALFGVSHVSSDAVEAGQRFIFSDTSFGMALGGGLDVRVNDRVAVRVVQVDYLRTRFFGATQNEGRIAAGIVFRFGKR